MDKIQNSEILKEKLFHEIYWGKRKEFIKDLFDSLIILDKNNVNVKDKLGNNALQAVILSSKPIKEEEQEEEIIEDEYTIKYSDAPITDEDLIELIEFFYNKSINFESINHNGHSPLESAVLTNNTPALKKLIACGAKVYYTKNKDDPSPKEGSILHFAVEYSNRISLNTIKALVESGVNINDKAFGITPLHFALTYPYATCDIIPILLDLGANIEEKSRDNLTPLQVAINIFFEFPDKVILKLYHLLFYGARIYINQDGTLLNFKPQNIGVNPIVFNKYKSTIQTLMFSVNTIDQLPYVTDIDLSITPLINLYSDFTDKNHLQMIEQVFYKRLYLKIFKTNFNSISEFQTTISKLNKNIDNNIENCNLKFLKEIYKPFCNPTEPESGFLSLLALVASKIPFAEVEKLGIDIIISFWNKMPEYLKNHANSINFTTLVNTSTSKIEFVGDVEHVD